MSRSDAEKALLTELIDQYMGRKHLVLHRKPTEEELVELRRCEPEVARIIDAGEEFHTDY